MRTAQVHAGKFPNTILIFELRTFRIASQKAALVRAIGVAIPGKIGRLQQGADKQGRSF